MSANGSISLAGLLGYAGGVRTGNISLSQGIDELEVKAFEVNAPSGASLAGAEWTAVPLQLSTGVGEAIVLALYAAKAVWVRITTTEDGAGSAEGVSIVKVKGHTFMTLAPGGGITDLDVCNEDLTDDVTLGVVVGAKRNATDDDPSFWT